MENKKENGNPNMIAVDEIILPETKENNEIKESGNKNSQVENVYK